MLLSYLFLGQLWYSHSSLQLSRNRCVTSFYQEYIERRVLVVTFFPSREGETGVWPVFVIVAAVLETEGMA